MTEKDLGKFKKYYSAEALLKKIGKMAKKAGLKLIYYVLLLWYTLQKEKTPASIKATIIGALGYFILPLDFLPDVIPVAGYADDLGAIGLAIALALAYIDDEVKEKAKKKLRDWFGEYDENELGKYETEFENNKEEVK